MRKPERARPVPDREQGCGAVLEPFANEIDKSQLFEDFYQQRLEADWRLNRRRDAEGGSGVSPANVAGART